MEYGRNFDTFFCGGRAGIFCDFSRQIKRGKIIKNPNLSAYFAASVALKKKDD